MARFNDNGSLIEQIEAVTPDRLPEPDLSYYLALRSQFDAAQLRVTVCSEMLQTFLNEVTTKRGYAGNVQVDRFGNLTRQAAPEPPEPALVGAGAPGGQPLPEESNP